MRVTVFGGSSPKPDQPAYTQAYQLGQLIAEHGDTVLTGGYIGTMEAVSRGANEAGGHVIGITCEEIEAWRPVGANPWVIEEIKEKTLKKRIDVLIEKCDAAFALPGGPGTLTEIMVMFNQMQIRAIPQRPLILIGIGWQETFQTFFSTQESYVPSFSKDLIQFAPDPHTGFQLLINHASD